MTAQKLQVCSGTVHWYCFRKLGKSRRICVMTYDIEVRLRKFESIKKDQNLKKNRTYRESELEVLFGN